jgi:hypothetical protein
MVLPDLRFRFLWETAVPAQFSDLLASAVDYLYFNSASKIDESNPNDPISKTPEKTWPLPKTWRNR